MRHQTREHREEVKKTFISKKRWEELEKRVADLEEQVQKQQLPTSETIVLRLKEILLGQLSSCKADTP